MKHTPWLERKFSFDFPVTHFPFIAERLRGTLPAIDEMIKGLEEEKLSHRKDGKWSIKEHIGHLIDLEEVHEGRIDDFKNKLKMLRAADMSNKKTYAADHNKTDIKEILKNFGSTRAHFIKRLDRFSEEEMAITAMHPRLLKEMRPVDMAYFVAEHDGHHLVLMRNSLNS